MISIISGTNREESSTLALSTYILRYVQRINEGEVRLLDLCDLNGRMNIDRFMYKKESQSPIVKELQDRYILPSDKFVFIVPEYNGSITGVLKFFIDAVSVRDYEKNFSGKDALLIGTSTGRAGNLRGLDHLTGILQFLDVLVYPKKIPISNITHVFEKASQSFIDDEAEKSLQKQIRRFINR